MWTSNLRSATEWALMVALVFGGGVVAQVAQADDQQSQVGGRVVRIGPDDHGVQPLPPPGGEADDESAGVEFGIPGQVAQQEMPKYWIGLAFAEIGPDSPLRAQLGIPENQGLLVDQVVANSPAEKAGLKRHDILLRANDGDMHVKRDLMEVVSTEGEKKAQITLEVMRHGQRETVYVTPEDRPADAQIPQGSLGSGGGRMGNIPDAFQVFKNFGGEDGNLPMEFRNFGPGVVVNGGGVANMPNGVSISIQKQEGQPTHITVKRGEETWEVTGDDPGSLEKLPADLRPSVEQMLHNNSAMHFNMPRMERPRGFGGNADQSLRERLEAMEKQMQELQQRLNHAENTPQSR